jgi:hypothetical protein
MSVHINKIKRRKVTENRSFHSHYRENHKTNNSELGNALPKMKISRYSDMLQAGQLGFDSWQGQELFLYSTVSRLALGPILPPIQWVLAVTRLRHEAVHTPPSSAKFKNTGAIPPPPMSSWRGA